MNLIIKMKTFQPSFPSNCWSLIDSHQYRNFSFYLVSILDRLGNILTFEGGRHSAFQADEKHQQKYIGKEMWGLGELPRVSGNVTF